MRKLLVLFLLIAGGSTAQAQDANKHSKTPSYNPAEANKNEGRGFHIDFTFTDSLYKGYQVVILKSYKIDFAKGYYKQTYGKPGKYYPCSELNNLCTTTVLSTLWITVLWEYNGKEFINGRQFVGQQFGNLYEYTNVKNFLTPPSDIPGAMVRNGSAKIKGYSIAVANTNTETEIENIIDAKINN